MHSFVTSKNVKWCHLIWPTLYMATIGVKGVKIMSGAENHC